MDPKVTADVLAVCDTLGVFDGRKYFKDPQCLSKRIKECGGDEESGLYLITFD